MKLKHFFKNKINSKFKLYKTRIVFVRVNNLKYLPAKSTYKPCQPECCIIRTKKPLKCTKHFPTSLLSVTIFPRSHHMWIKLSVNEIKFWENTFFCCVRRIQQRESTTRLGTTSACMHTKLRFFFSLPKLSLCYLDFISMSNLAQFIFFYIYWRSS